jgi:HlyD family secretion protein
VTRTVYLRDKSAPAGKPKVIPVVIKTGISDGAFTEVLEGLKEGDEVVIGSTAPAGAPAGAAVPQGKSPFGGGFGRGR